MTSSIVYVNISIQYYIRLSRIQYKNLSQLYLIWVLHAQRRAFRIEQRCLYTKRWQSSIMLDMRAVTCSLPVVTEFLPSENIALSTRVVPVNRRLF